MDLKQTLEDLLDLLTEILSVIKDKKVTRGWFRRTVKRYRKAVWSNFLAPALSKPLDWVDDALLIVMQFRILLALFWKMPVEERRSYIKQPNVLFRKIVNQKD
jgi:hypothetical protein